MVFIPTMANPKPNNPAIAISPVGIGLLKSLSKSAQPVLSFVPQNILKLMGGHDDPPVNHNATCITRRKKPITDKRLPPMSRSKPNSFICCLRGLVT